MCNYSLKKSVSKNVGFSRNYKNIEHFCRLCYQENVMQNSLKTLQGNSKETEHKNAIKHDIKMSSSKSLK